MKPQTARNMYTLIMHITAWNVCRVFDGAMPRPTARFPMSQRALIRQEDKC